MYATSVFTLNWNWRILYRTIRYPHPPNSPSMNSKARRPRLNSQSLILPTRTLRRRNLVVIRRKELHQTAKNPHRRIRIGKGSTCYCQRASRWWKRGARSEECRGDEGCCWKEIRVGWQPAKRGEAGSLHSGLCASRLWCRYAPTVRQ